MNKETSLFQVQLSAWVVASNKEKGLGCTEIEVSFLGLLNHLH